MRFMKTFLPFLKLIKQKIHKGRRPSSVVMCLFHFILLFGTRLEPVSRFRTEEQILGVRAKACVPSTSVAVPCIGASFFSSIAWDIFQPVSDYPEH